MPPKSAPSRAAAYAAAHPGPWIAPSILAADFARLGEEVADVQAGGADLVHFDVMDNHYVPNLSVGPAVLSALRRHDTSALVDVHLMAQPVDRLVDEFLAAGADVISFHVEASDNPRQVLRRIRDGGAWAGLVFNADVPIDGLEPLLHAVDLVLVMSVQAGFGGQAFMPSSLAKVRAARRMIEHGGCHARLEIDGGIKVENIAQAHAAGADTFVAGSSIFGVPASGSDRAADYRAAIDAMRGELGA